MIGLRRKRVEAVPPSASDTSLPADVLAAIEGASIIHRHSVDDDGTPRIFVQWAHRGMQSFLYTDETAAESLAKLYPELNDRQIVRACFAMAGVVKASLRGPAQFEGQVVREKKNWVTNW